MPDAAERKASASEIDPATIARCRAQDPAAFRAFVTHYQDVVFAILARVVGRADVADLAQETFLRAFRAFPRFELDGRARPSTWLLTIAVRLALNARRAARPTEPLDSSNDLAAAAATPEAAVTSAELGGAIQAAADALPDDQRAAFVLVELHGCALAEAAAMLEVPEATVKTRVFRARAKMRERLRPWIEGGER